jgi:hypothetical protein
LREEHTRGTHLGGDKVPLEADVVGDHDGTTHDLKQVADDLVKHRRRGDVFRGKPVDVDRSHVAERIHECGVLLGRICVEPDDRNLDDPITGQR